MAMQTDRRLATLSVLVPFTLLVGLVTYAVRLRTPLLPGGAPAPDRPPLHSLPAPVRVTPEQARNLELPPTLDGYKLVSVVPAVPGHELHALYEAEHHISLFIRPNLHHGTDAEVGPGWSHGEKLEGHPAYQREDRNHREALAWIARGKRHIVTGDVDLNRLRHFATYYEKALGNLK